MNSRVILYSIAVSCTLTSSPSRAGEIAINPQGTYLHTNTHPSGGQKPDNPGKPTTLTIKSLKFGSLDPSRHFIALQSSGTICGHYDSTSGCQNPINGAIAVFRDNQGSPIPAGSLAPGTAIVSSPTLYDAQPTDIPQDFSIPNGTGISANQPITVVQVPPNAVDLAISANDSFFSDNADPSKSYKLTYLTLHDALAGGFKYTVDANAVQFSFKSPLGLSVAQFEALGGFRQVNWRQSIVSLPQPSPYVAAAAPTTPLVAPFSDPPNGGYASPMSEFQSPGAYPYYYNDAAIAAATSSDGTISMVDNPVDRCLDGGNGAPCHNQTAPAGQKIIFKTTLVGIDKYTNQAVSLVEVTWTSSYNGTTGGAQIVAVSYLE